jgi:CheY-like chemotaxis protein
MDRTTRVLVVDDDPGFAELTGLRLERCDEAFETVAETGGEAGLDHIGEVDCVVSDYDMPGTDGLEFLAAVREREPDLPFVLFTGKGSEEIASRAISAGVTDYLQKGSGDERYEMLANRVRNAVERSRAEFVERTETRYRRLVEQNLFGIYILQGGGWSTPIRGWPRCSATSSRSWSEPFYAGPDSSATSISTGPSASSSYARSSESRSVVVRGNRDRIESVARYGIAPRSPPTRVASAQRLSRPLRTASTRTATAMQAWTTSVSSMNRLRTRRCMVVPTSARD